MNKIKELINDKNNVLVFDVDGVLAKLEWGKHNHYELDDEAWTKICAEGTNCYTQEWYENWQRNGWINSKGEDVANQDLWIEIIPYFDNFWYNFKKVDGHSGIYWNEECDKLAQDCAEQLRINWRGKNE